jgi:hypothetical protein
MNCPKCGREIPAGQLACMCFQERADAETEERALRSFVLGGPLYFACATGHLLPAPGHGVTLCRKQRFKRVSVRAVLSGAVKPPAHLPRACTECEAKAQAFIEARIR